MRQRKSKSGAEKAGPRVQVIGWAENFFEQVFAGSRVPFAIFAIPVAVWGTELVMNLKSGEGWVFALHLLVITPLWIGTLSLLLYAGMRELANKYARVKSDGARNRA
jgi:hypothetical protein